MAKKRGYIDNNPLWYKDAVVYQLHVKTFYDSNNDGIGEFRGLTEKLDYLRNLGVTAIWLLPFYPSPLRDDGYDIADYYNVHSRYGTLRDFKEFLRQAHSRGIRVITELVINHTSDQHPWFQRARKAGPGTKHGDYYVWSRNPDKYKDARIIFGDFESSNWKWDEEAKAYYWHRFYSHQPDLNFDNPDVQKEIFRVMDYWFSMGVDGMRLDAVPYLFEKEGTNCENLPQTYDFLRKLRKHVDAKFDNKMLLAEANQWPEDAVAYFGKGDICHMAFHFPLMPRMYMSVQMEDRFPLIDILEQTPKIHPKCQWAIFLRNHDELTLEMVTDEERDYMYRAYAKDAASKINLGIRRRLVPLLGNNRRKIELMNVLLFSLPGTPIIYYGDEIGMGDNRFLGDRDGVRTPMQWSPDRNGGFSKVNPQELYLPVIIDSEYHYETVNVETQENNQSSLLWWMKRVIAMGKRYKAFSSGELKFLFPENTKVLCFTRQYKNEIVLVVINLSRFAQYVKLDLKEYSGFKPKELFSQSYFPGIKEDPYTVTIGPHGHYWFLLERAQQDKLTNKEKILKLSDSWHEILEEKSLKRFETDVLPEYLYRARWFRSKSRKIRAVKVADILDLNPGCDIRILIVQVFFTTGDTESYFLPLAFVFSKEDHRITRDFPGSVISHVKVNGREGIIYDGIYNNDMRSVLLDLALKRKKIRSGSSSINGYPGKKIKKIIEGKITGMESRVLMGEQSNTSVIYGNKLYLKLFRKLEQGVNPDIEITKYLTEKRKTDIIPVFAGHIEYNDGGPEQVSLAIIQGCIPNPTDFWAYTLDNVKRFFEVYLAGINKSNKVVDDLHNENGNKAVSPGGFKTEGILDAFYEDLINLLGQRTGEMHLELSSDKDDQQFRPESFSMLYQRALYQAMGSQTRYVLGLLRKNLQLLDKGLRDEAEEILSHEKAILSRFKRVLKKKYTAKKIRIHGDYHLGQVVYTGKDFVIIDFEGEPAKPISERKLKRSALRDIAGMVRSLHYAASATLLLNKSVRKEDSETLESAAEVWYTRMSGIFLDSYYKTVSGSDILPKQKADLEALFQVYLLDKAIYELGYELNNRPDWLFVPIKGIKNILDIGGKRQ
ncbi:MAG: maltose alpha-D-glucosyltransferase [Candidatus Omnitrophota bacterium]